MYKITFKKSALKEYNIVPIYIQNSIDEKLLLLSIGRDDEVGSELLRPAKKERYRFRVWKYRVIYQKNDERLIVDVIKIWSRWDVYKNI